MKTIIKKGILNLGEIKCGKPDASIEWELRQSENGPEFSASASVWEPSRRDISLGGQCVDKVQRKYSGNEMAKRIRAVWEKYHLNSMSAGLPAQEAAIREWEAAGNRYEYDAVCTMLKAKGLYEAPVPEGVTCTGGFPADVQNGTRGYRYGERWVYSPIPQGIIDEIMSW